MTNIAEFQRLAELQQVQIKEHRPFTLWVRYKQEVNTDPQGRCYNGCFPSSEWRWTHWVDLLDYRTLEEAQDTKDTFSRSNDMSKREYIIVNLVTGEVIS